jgi:hypothetical protein
LKLLIAGGYEDDRRSGVVAGELVYVPDDTGDEFVGLATGGRTTSAVVAEVDITPQELASIVADRFGVAATPAVLHELIEPPRYWEVGAVCHRTADGDEWGPP